MAAVILSVILHSIDITSQHKGHTFVKDVQRWVEVFQGEFRLIGKLDSEGNFLQFYKYRVGNAVSGGVPTGTVINRLIIADEAVYEYQSGLIVRGSLKLDGSFKADIDAVPFAFENYKYSNKSLRIWNLPGYFTKSTTKK